MSKPLVPKGPRLDAISANEAGSLLSALAQVDIAVPPRGKGRTSHHTERWTICRLVATLTDTDLLGFPLTLTHEDKPDFVIATPTGRIGVEVSEAIPVAYAKFSEIANREHPGAVLELCHFRPNSPALTTKQMRGLLANQRLTGPGWQGDAPERDWANFMRSRILAKQQSLSKTGFRVLSRNWLAMYDNLPYPIRSASDALMYLDLSEVWRAAPTFESIFIEHADEIVALHSDGSARTLKLRDLWRSAGNRRALENTVV